MHVDHSRLFCGFFCVSQYGIVTQAFIYPSLFYVKSLFQFSLTDLKFGVNACSLFGFPSPEIKSDDGYQSRQQILYRMISFIQ